MANVASNGPKSCDVTASLKSSTCRSNNASRSSSATTGTLYEPFVRVEYFVQTSVDVHQVSSTDRSITVMPTKPHTPTVRRSGRHRQSPYREILKKPTGTSVRRGQVGRGQDVIHGLVDVIGQVKQLEVARPDLAFGQHGAAYPVQQATPVRPTQQDDREPGHLARLHQGQRLEHLVQGAEAARQHTERLSVLDEHRLAGEEVPEVDADLDPLVHALLER